MAAGLGRCGSDSGDRTAVGLDRGGEVADHENLRTSRHRKVRLNEDASGAVERHTEVAAERRRGDARRPEHGAGLDPSA
jgi:hypothetical protein